MNEILDPRTGQDASLCGGTTRDGRPQRLGYTTGSCAAAASAAAARMLLQGREVERIDLLTPAGLLLRLQVLEITRGEDFVRCAIRKESGTDPDVTNGMLVFAEVRRSGRPGVAIDGGEGVGRVTRPGLDQRVGAAAINSVPRRMIREALSRELEAAGESCGLSVLLSIPGGEERAAHTFNPRLGIVGGLSVLGTTGIVQPMSEQALVDTIRVELSVRAASGGDLVCIAPGSYGKDFLLRSYGFSLELAVTCSNFIADTVRMAAAAGFSRLLLVGHIGKLVKVAAGVENTHSRYGDRRMSTLREILLDLAAAGELPLSRDEVTACGQELLSCVSTDAALALLERYGVRERVMTEMTGRILHWLRRWAGEGLQVEVLVYSTVYGLLGESKGAERDLSELAGKAEGES